MTENSKIEWTDHTINFWEGCDKVSPGCKNCYAENRANRWGFDIWGKNKPRKFIKSAVPNALRLNRKAEKEGVRYKVFSNSLADFFEADTGQAIVDHNSRSLYVGVSGEFGPVTLTDLRRHAFEIIDRTPHLDWLILTKRPENILKMWRGDQIGPYRGIRESGVGVFERKNVWLGTSVENQEQADKRIPELLKCCDLSPVLFLSCEPLLGAVDLSQHLWTLGELHAANSMGMGWKQSINWIICGGESGHGARPMHPDWARSLRDQCQAAGVPFFFKQWGAWLPDDGRPLSMPHTDMTTDGQQWGGIQINSTRMIKVGKKAAGRLLDGREWSEFPEREN